MPRITPSKIKSYWKEHGTLGLAKKAVLRMFLSFFSYSPLDFYCICGAPQTQLHAKCPLEIRKGGSEDMDMFVEISVISSENSDRAAIRKEAQRLLDNGELFLAFSEGKLVHIAWLHYCAGTDKVYPHVKIDKDEAFIGHCGTHPAFRGKNIYPVVLQHIVRYAATKNKHRCFITTGPTLVASIRGIEKAGFSFVGRLRRFRLLGKLFNNHWISSKRI